MEAILHMADLLHVDLLCALLIILLAYSARRPRRGVLYYLFLHSLLFVIAYLLGTRPDGPRAQRSTDLYYTIPFVI